MPTDNHRVSPAFMLVQTLLINFMAKAKMPTTEIAEKLGVNRSYVIRLSEVNLAANSKREVDLLELAKAEYEGNFQRMGLKGLLSDQTLTTVLAGGERPKLGPLVERRAAKAAEAVQAPTEAPPAVTKIKRVKGVPAFPAASASAPVPSTDAPVIRKGKGADKGLRTKNADSVFGPESSQLGLPEPAPRLSIPPSGGRGKKNGAAEVAGTTANGAALPAKENARGRKAKEGAASAAPKAARVKADATSDLGTTPPKAKRKASPAGAKGAAMPPSEATVDELLADLASE